MSRHLILLMLCLCFPAKKSFAAQCVDINQDGIQVLSMQLTGIGPAKARAIVNYRTDNGPFTSESDLLNVKGIGPKTLDKIKEQLCKLVAAAAGAAITQNNNNEQQTRLKIRNVIKRARVSAGQNQTKKNAPR